MMRDGPCSRSCTAAICPADDDDDDYYGLEFWMIIIIGAGAGTVVIIALVIFFCIAHCYWYDVCDMYTLTLNEFHVYSCRKKNGGGMVRLKDDTDHAGIENYGYKDKTLKKSKIRMDFDEFGSTNKLLTAGRGALTKLKWKRATRKAPTYIHHENIYDLDEVDSKFEGKHE